MQPWRTIPRIEAKYAAVARQAARNRLAYPKDILGRAMFLVLLLFVYGALWAKVLGARGDFAGFSRARLIWYMALTEAVTFALPRLQNTINEDVRTGNVACRLNRPLSYPGQLLAEYLGEAAANAGTVFVIAAITALVLTGVPPDLHPAHLLAVAATLLLGVLISFWLMFCLAMTAFWVEDNSPYFWLYSKINFVLGGLFIPVEIYPGLLRRTAEFLPFRLAFASSARLAVKFDWPLLWQTIAAQGCWLLLLGGLALAVYRKGVRKLNVNGG